MSAPEVVGQLQRPVDLAPGVGAPDPLGQQQRRRVDGHDRYAVQLGQRAQRARLLGDRVGPDHDLDAVVAQPLGQVERGGAALGVDRCGRQGHAGAGHLDGSGHDPERNDRRAGSCAPAVGPRGHGSAGDPRPVRRRMTPSRRAHGQMSSAVDAEQVHRRLGDDGPGQQLPGPARRRPPAASARCRTVIREPADDVADVRQRQGPGGVGALGAGRGAGDPGQRAHRLAGADRPVGGTGLGEVAQHAGDVRPDLLAQGPDLGRVRRVLGLQRRAGEPAGAERQAERGVGLLVQPGGQLQRAAADVDHEQPPAGPAEPAARGEEGQPRLVLAARAPGGRPPSRPSTRARTSSPLGASRIALVAKARRSSTPWSSATVRHSWVNCTSASAPARVDPAVRLDVLGQPQLDLVRRRRQRVAADVGVDDQQVHRVGSHVDDPESHGSNVARTSASRAVAPLRICPAPGERRATGPRTEETVAAPRLEPCPRLPWTSAARGSSSPTPPMPSSATAAT